MNTKSYTYIILICLFTCIYHAGKAQQEINKTVEVVKQYTPVVSDASKINVMPEFTDTVVLRPDFQYNIVPTAINSEYQLNKINPAKMLSMPLTKLYKGYLKLGVGNYITPLAEFSYNSPRSKNYTYGAFFHHQSSNAKLKLDNSEKVFAGYSETEASVYGKRYFSESFLYADASYSTNTSYQYGYNPDTILNFEKGDIRQKVFRAGINAGFRSSHTDSSRLSYHANVKYFYTQNRWEQGQNDFRIMLEGSQLYKNLLIGANANFLLLQPNEKLDSMKYSNSLFSVKPYVVLSNPNYRLTGDLNLILQHQLDKFSFYAFPEAQIDINIAKDVLIGFAGVKGTIKEHSYYDIYQENPYIKPDLVVENTKYEASMYGGFKGNLGSKASFILKADVMGFKNDYLFVNVIDTITKADNQFSVIYCSGSRVNVYAETNYDLSNSLSVSLKADFNKYDLDNEAHAWHRPGFQMIVSPRYNLRNKIIANLDIIYAGKRYARIFENDTIASKELSGIVDVNLGLEYRYTKILSAWVRLNNIAATKFYSWNYYPTQRFNIMIGITYSL